MEHNVPFLASHFRDQALLNFTHLNLHQHCFLFQLVFCGKLVMVVFGAFAEQTAGKQQQPA